MDGRGYPDLLIYRERVGDILNSMRGLHVYKL